MDLRIMYTIEQDIELTEPDTVVPRSADQSEGPARCSDHPYDGTVTKAI